jgi:hypothetical protein
MKIRSILTATVVAAGALCGSALAAPQGQFADVSPTNWAYNAILQLRDRYGVAVGYPDQTFRAGRTATRAELAALVNATLDQITSYVDAKDAALASALKAEFSREIAATNTRVSALEVRNEAKDRGVGSYIGAAVTLQRQGIDGGGKDYNDTVAGASVVGRVPVASVWGNEVSLRPYLTGAAGPNSNIAASTGILATYDWSIAKSTLADGSKVSNTNIYLGGGGQWALTNDGQANRQASIGQGSQAIFVTGIERRLSNKFVAFGDLLWPTQNDGVRGAAYSPVGRIGFGIKL